MSVIKLALSTHKYTGLSTDAKPTGVPAGSTFLTTDTQTLYITYDGTNWVLKEQTGEVQASPTSNTVLARLKDISTGIDEANDFSGVVYENQDTAAADTARRFETTSKKLRDVVIKVSTYAQYFGDASNQRLQVGVDGTLGFTLVDLSTLYFKNVEAGKNGTVTILGVEE